MRLRQFQLLFALLVAFLVGALTHRSGIFQTARGGLFPAHLYDHTLDTPLLAARRGIHAAFPARADIAMVGDSITEQMNWQAAFPDVRVANLGISHDTTAGVLARLDNIAGTGARTVVLSIGINDIRAGLPLAGILERHEEIRGRLATAGAHVAVVSLVTGQRQIKEAVAQANQSIAAACRAPSCTFVDISPAGGLLRPEHTYDSVHLTADAYRIWVAAIRPLVVSAGH